MAVTKTVLFLWLKLHLFTLYFVGFKVLYDNKSIKNSVKCVEYSLGYLKETFSPKKFFECSMEIIHLKVLIIYYCKLVFKEWGVKC